MTKLDKMERKLKNFKDWLAARGAEVLPSTSEWEVLRFVANNKTCIIYTDKTGERISFIGEAQDAWDAFKSGGSWRAVAIAKNIPSKVRSTLLRQLIIRDKGVCFYCLHQVADEDASQEHLIARTQGGPDNLHNKVLAHKACNEMVGHKSLLEKIDIRTRSLIAKEAKKNEY